MDDRRFEVFVSSTFFDLQEERAAVSKVLLEMDAFPSGMELFPATDADSWTLIQQVIDSADYYLLIVGGRYGSVSDTTDLSYTEMEYDYAVEHKKPVMAFVHGEPGSIVLSKSEVNAEGVEKRALSRKGRLGEAREVLDEQGRVSREGRDYVCVV